MIRDELCLIRTHLANERTLLAYVRTALAFVASGAGMIHFFQTLLLHFTGWFLLGAGVIVFLIGAIHFVHVQRRINNLFSESE